MSIKRNFYGGYHWTEFKVCLVMLELVELILAGAPKQPYAAHSLLESSAQQCERRTREPVFNEQPNRLVVLANLIQQRGRQTRSIARGDLQPNRNLVDSATEILGMCQRFSK